MTRHKYFHVVSNAASLLHTVTRRFPAIFYTPRHPHKGMLFSVAAEQPFMARMP
ncbi:MULTISPECIES: hypothetical protein [Thalassolituus]|uniref:hypothetical protein n=1 Tax=Thalassolituus TaxID=187492 RepID=UPI00264A4744|nr:MULTISPECIES: hypothetical protein [Thalassolituus]